MLAAFSRNEKIKRQIHSEPEETQRTKEIIAVVFGLCLIGNALLFVPQAMAVWRKKSDEGISLITFGGFCVLEAVSVAHGL
jgi:hypothetical protein